jgi:hypothetical protein
MSDALKGLLAARELMNRMGPQPIALWVVDTMWAATAIRKAYRERGFIAHYPGMAKGEMLAGPIPVREWLNTPEPSHADYERMLTAGCWFVRWPGLWLQMTDGRHTRVQVASLAEAEKIAVTLLADYRGFLNDEPPVTP